MVIWPKVLQLLVPQWVPYDSYNKTLKALTPEEMGSYLSIFGMLGVL
jgi:hypothetical protein